MTSGSGTAVLGVSTAPGVPKASPAAVAAFFASARRPSGGQTSGDKKSRSDQGKKSGFTVEEEEPEPEPPVAVVIERITRNGEILVKFNIPLVVPGFAALPEDTGPKKRNLKETVDGCDGPKDTQGSTL